MALATGREVGLRPLPLEDRATADVARNVVVYGPQLLLHRHRSTLSIGCPPSTGMQGDLHPTSSPAGRTGPEPGTAGRRPAGEVVVRYARLLSLRWPRRSPSGPDARAPPRSARTPSCSRPAPR